MGENPTTFTVRQTKQQGDTHPAGAREFMTPTIKTNLRMSPLVTFMLNVYLANGWITEDKYFEVADNLTAMCRKIYQESI